MQVYRELNNLLQKGVHSIIASVNVAFSMFDFNQNASKASQIVQILSAVYIGSIQMNGDIQFNITQYPETWVYNEFYYDIVLSLVKQHFESCI